MSKNRIAIVDPEKCKPTKCKRECISMCPPQSGGKEVIRIVEIEDIGFLLNSHKCGFIIEHDIMMAVSFAQEMSSNILLVEKISDANSETKVSQVSDYMGFTQGINKFLQTLNITMRIAGHNRPRINKGNSQLDKEQKEANNYYM